MLTRQQDQRQTQVRELLNAASQGDLEESRPSAVTIEIHFHIAGPVVIGAEVVGTMIPVLMQLVESATKHQ